MIEHVQADPNHFREYIANHFVLLMGNEHKIGTNIEKGIFNYAIREASIRETIKKWKNPIFCEVYLARVRTIIANLSKNQELLESVKNGSIAPDVFARISHQEMDPERWRELIERKSKKDQSRFQNHLEASTDMFTCKKCKSKN